MIYMNLEDHTNKVSRYCGYKYDSKEFSKKFHISNVYE